MRPVLVLRPEPGAAATVGRVRSRGWRAIAAPLFAVEAVEWKPPDSRDHDALMLTSANAVRFAGPHLGGYRALPAYAVGEATAAALREAGFADVRTGSADAAALLAMLAADGRRAPLHLAGADVREVVHPGVSVAQAVVYRAVPAGGFSPEAERALRDGAVALLHSPRAAARFAELAKAAGMPRAGIALAAISAATASAAGGGWSARAIAAAPDDEALLAAAAPLCEGDGRETDGRG